MSRSSFSKAYKEIASLEPMEMTFTIEDADLDKLHEVLNDINVKECPWFEVQDKHGNKARYYRESQMTLDEAIIHCEEVADRCAMTDGDLKCEREHRQLAGWLKLLKRILDSGGCNDCEMLHSPCRYAPGWGEQVRYNCPFYSKEGNKK